MENLLVKLMILAALAKLGMSLTELESCHSRQCFQNIEQHSRDILRIDWQPISVFPEEARKFR